MATVLSSKLCVAGAVILRVTGLPACAAGDGEHAGRGQTVSSERAGVSLPAPRAASPRADVAQLASFAGSNEYEQCSHGLCEEGKGLAPACHPCVEIVCAADGACCEEAWTADCVQYAGWLCGACGASGCAGLPPEGACLGDLAVSCLGGRVAWEECAPDETCEHDEVLNMYSCGGD